jgi:hypothetical protein
MFQTPADFADTLSLERNSTTALERRFTCRIVARSVFPAATGPGIIKQSDNPWITVIIIFLGMFDSPGCD